MYRMLLIAAFLASFAVVAVGCQKPPQPGGASGAKPEQARRAAQNYALLLVNGAAEAQAKAIPSLAANKGKSASPASPTAATTTRPQLPLRPNFSVAIRERVSGTLPAATEAEADEDSVAVACDTIERKLAELDPPVIYRPTVSEVKNEFIRRDGRNVRTPDPVEQKRFTPHGVGPNLVYVEYEVEVSADQVRELRTHNRVAESLVVVAGLTALALAGFLFLRLDEWSKGYLTRWLAIGAVALAAGAAAAVYLV